MLVDVGLCVVVDVAKVGVTVGATVICVVLLVESVNVVVDGGAVVDVALSVCVVETVDDKVDVELGSLVDCVVVLVVNAVVEMVGVSVVTKVDVLGAALVVDSVALVIAPD